MNKANKAVTWQEQFATKSDDELKAEAHGLHQSINVTECFGVHDLIEYDALLEELERRGHEAVTGLAWIDHSVNCYFCKRLFDEREGCEADEYNDGDGGSICPSCLTEKGGD